MQFSTIFATIISLAVAAQACTPGQYACGNQNGAPGPDGSVQVCNSAGRWQLSAQCGGRTCCHNYGGGRYACAC